MDIKTFREENGYTVKQVVDVVKTSAKGFDRYLLSKVENPDKYGVRLLDHIEQDVRDMQKHMPKPKKEYPRKKPCRVSFRLGKMKMRQLLEASATEGFTTMQDLLEYIVTCWLEERQ